MPVDVLWENASVGAPAYDALELRRIDSGLLLGTAPATVLGGVRPGNDLKVSLSGSTITIEPGNFAVPSAATGVYRGGYPPAHADLIKGLSPADGSFARKDAVWVRIYDNEIDGLGRRDGEVQYAAGNPSGTPALPTAPDGPYELLATIDVPKTGSGAPVVNDARRFYSAAGGVLYVKARPASAYPGLVIYRLDIGIHEMWDGTAWRNLTTVPWQTWAAVWTGPTPLAIGNGQMTALWRDFGNAMHFKLAIRRGSTTNVGSGTYSFSVPAPMTTYDTDDGTGHYRVAATPSTAIPCIWIPIGTTAVALIRAADQLRIGFNTYAWEAGDFISMSGWAQKNPS
jgi:hypothetical protein